MASSENVKKKIPHWQITYYDEQRSMDTVIVGAWELAQAERKFYVGAVTQGSMDAILFAAFMAARRSKLVGDGMNFDAWAEQVARVDEVEAGESQTPLES